MPCALIKNGLDVLRYFPDSAPVLTDGGRTLVASPGAQIGWQTTTPDGNHYALIESVLDADQSGKVGTIDLANSAIVDGVAHIVRAWATLTPQVPESVDLLQCKVWLIRQGLKAQVDALIAAQNNAELSERWAYGNRLYRSEPLLNVAAASFGKSPADVDAAFIEMAQI